MGGNGMGNHGRGVSEKVGGFLDKKMVAGVRSTFLLRTQYLRRTLFRWNSFANGLSLEFNSLIWYFFGI